MEGESWTPEESSSDIEGEVGAGGRRKWSVDIFCVGGETKII
eukprot:CAMPEP_0182509206 /NCGR_PEP_ID=MMETSP1321-20130603/26456_1 /TAXON_ID=91990 /ORGANISM="Bolidomonas sp., Strain RCC1657" /LENGTH=41 /DNA_ID= /DNA_START= /DNA_END= /DNA_ORIENTATION=